jgi:phosphatidylglycerol:prolipoprotein diacylglycerol transferase
MYVAFNALSVFVGLIVMVIVTVHFSKVLHPAKKNLAYKAPRVKYIVSTMISFLVAYVFLYMGTQLIGKIKFKDMNMEGVAFIGGVLLFIPVFVLFAYHLPNNGDTLSQLERTFPSLAIMQCFNRLACTCAGCCFGVPFKLGLTYQRNTPAVLKYGLQTRLFPTAPFESFVMLIAFIVIIIFMMKKKKDTLHLFPIFFGGVGLVNQFLMGDLRGIMIWKIFDVQQMGYMILIALGLFFYFYRQYDRKKAEVKLLKPKKAH